MAARLSTDARRILGAQGLRAAGALFVGAWADRLGRRRCYVALFLGIAGGGAVLGLGPPLWVILLLGLVSVLSTDVVDNGPATTLGQVMLAAEDTAVAGRSGARAAGTRRSLAGPPAPPGRGEPACA